MDRVEIQRKLGELYIDWKKELQFNKQDSDCLSSPLLLSVTDNYCRAEKRILFFGQETAGWQWNKKLREEFPLYPSDWPYKEVWSMSDFLANEDAIEGLCWAYREFAFAERQPKAHRSPFWRAFREVQGWEGAGVMWSNVAKTDYSPPKGSNEGNSIFLAPEHLREALITQQARLVSEEISILKPDVCLFLTGPYYDEVIEGTLSKCEFLPCDELKTREMAQVANPLLPVSSFRTYHPNHLRYGKWEYIEKIRSKLTANSTVESTGWSNDLKAQTRNLIEGRGMLASRDGQLHLKHATGGFGTIAEDDLMRGVLKLVEDRTGAETTFANVDELIAAGWVVD